MYQEHFESGILGDLLFEYEIPLNVTIEKLAPSFVALNFLDKGEFVGFHFSSGEADCSAFNQMLSDLAEKLVNDPKESTALKEVSFAREQRREQAAKRLCESIDLDVIVAGTGDEDHGREVYKFLAACDITMEDMEKEETMNLI